MHTAGGASAAAFSAATAGRREMPSAAPNMTADAHLLPIPDEDMETGDAVAVLKDLVPMQEGSGLGAKAAAPSTSEANETSLNILKVSSREVC